MTRRPLNLLLILLAAGLLLAAVPAAGPAATPRRLDAWNLHPGSRGQRVGLLQWMLSGHCPNRYAVRCGGKVKPTMKLYTPRVYGPRTKHGVLAMRYRLGFPAKGQCGARASKLVPEVGPWFFALLEGKVVRPRCWVGLAAARINGAVTPGATRTALAIRALELSQLGVHESPSGSNRGPRISYASGGYGPYQGATGAYGLAWCASYGDWALKRVTGHGFGSSNDAYVPAIAEYAASRGWLEAKPSVGSYVVFLRPGGGLWSAYHIGFVVKVTASGVQTIEGNASDPYGGGVHEVWRPFATYHMVYVNKPGVA